MLVYIRLIKKASSWTWWVAARNNIGGAFDEHKASEDVDLGGHHAAIISFEFELILLGVACTCMFCQWLYPLHRLSLTYHNYIISFGHPWARSHLFWVAVEQTPGLGLPDCWLPFLFSFAFITVLAGSIGRGILLSVWAEMREQLLFEALLLLLVAPAVNYVFAVQICLKPILKCAWCRLSTHTSCDSDWIDIITTSESNKLTGRPGILRYKCLFTLPDYIAAPGVKSALDCCAINKLVTSCPSCFREPWYWVGSYENCRDWYQIKEPE